MERLIIVKKNRSQRIGIYCVLVLIILALVAVFMLWLPSVETILLFFPAILPVLLILLYYETWQVALGPNTISIKCLFFRDKTYSYSQLIDVHITFSYTLHEHICITLPDGKCIRLRTEDENFSKARRKLQSHYSIRNK